MEQQPIQGHGNHSWMKLKADLSDIRRTVPWLGFNENNGRYGVKVLTFMVIALILTTNCIVDFVINWSDIDIRVDGLKGLFVYLFFGICLSTIIFDWDNTNLLMEIIEDRFYKYPFQATKTRLELEAQIEDEMVIVQSVWFNGRPVYTSSEILPPIIMLIFRLLTTNIHELTVNMLFTTHRYYWPNSQESMIVYSIALTLQTLFYFYMIKAGYVVLSSAFVSMYLIAGEMRLMALSVEEMDTVIGLQDTHIESTADSQHCGLNKTPRIMKLYLNHLVKHHQHIYRTAKSVNRGIQLVAFYLNSGSAVLLVTAIYVMVQRDGVIAKLQEAIYCFFMLLTSYFYNIMGQEVIIQDEHLRKALYQGQWTDKPQWFKKSLQIIMTRATRPIQMRPMRLFVLDLQNFRQLLKAIYTFYNVLNNLKATED